MSDELLVKVDGVSKKFCRSLKRSLWYGLQDVGRELLGRGGDQDELRKNEFWALRDVSFELRRGECLGLIGPNGAGKSTLLKMLNGLTKPDTGKITMRGRVGALIELGAGFNPILTARENVYINGAVLGMSKREVNASFENIIDFAELEEFVDMPVQSFSSGMKVRLGFAIAVQMKPDILIIDEVLAVGDVGFRNKCYNAIYKICENTAVIFVSHNMNQIDRLCSRGILLNRGEVALAGMKMSSVISKYYELFEARNESHHIADKVKYTCTRINGIVPDEPLQLEHSNPLDISFSATFPKTVKEIEISVSFLTSSMELIANANSKYEEVVLAVEGHPKTFHIRIPSFPMGSGKYFISLQVRDKKSNQILIWSHAFAAFQVFGPHHIPAPVRFFATWASESESQGRE